MNARKGRRCLQSGEFSIRVLYGIRGLTIKLAILSLCLADSLHFVHATSNPRPLFLRLPESSCSCLACGFSASVYRVYRLPCWHAFLIGATHAACIPLTSKG